MKENEIFGEEVEIIEEIGSPETETAELIPAEPMKIAPSVDQLIEIAEKNIELIKKLIKISVKITNENDWVDLGGKPYLRHSGAEKIAARFGVSWEINNIEKTVSEDEKGKYFIYTAVGTFSLPTTPVRKIQAIGVASSRQNFWGWEGGEIKPLSEISEAAIKKHAVTNCILNGLTHLLGLRSLSWEDFQETGIKVEKIPRVEFKKNRAAEKQIKEEKKKDDDSIEMLRNKIKLRAAELAGNDKEKMKKIIREASRVIWRNETYYFTDPEKIKNLKWLKKTLEKLNEVKY